MNIAEFAVAVETPDFQGVYIEVPAETENL